MTSNHITHHLLLSRVSELHKEAAAVRFANEVAHSHRVGVGTLLARWLRARRGRTRGPQPKAASDAG
jgi:hypothetical protein